MLRFSALSSFVCSATPRWAEPFVGCSQCFSALSSFVCSATRRIYIGGFDTKPNVSVPSRALCVLRLCTSSASSGPQGEGFQCPLELCVFCDEYATAMSNGRYS